MHGICWLLLLGVVCRRCVLLFVVVEIVVLVFVVSLS